MTTARRTRRKAAHRQVIIESLGWIVAAVVAGLWIATEWKAWLMVAVGVLIATAAGMAGALWLISKKTRINPTKPPTRRPAKREPNYINPARPKDKATWPTYPPSEVPEMREPEAQTVTDLKTKKRPTTPARQVRRAARVAKRQGKPPPLSPEESMSIMSRLLDEPEPEHGFNEIKSVSLEEHRAQLRQALNEETEK